MCVQNKQVPCFGGPQSHLATCIPQRHRPRLPCTPWGPGGKLQALAGGRPTQPSHKKPLLSFLVSHLRQAGEILSIKVRFLCGSSFKLSSVAPLRHASHLAKRFMSLFPKSLQTDGLKIELAKIKAHARVGWRLSSHTLHWSIKPGATPASQHLHLPLNQPLIPKRATQGITSIRSLLLVPKSSAGSDTHWPLPVSSSDSQTSTGVTDPRHRPAWSLLDSTRASSCFLGDPQTTPMALTLLSIPAPSTLAFPPQGVEV